MSKAKKYTGGYPRKVKAIARGVFGKVREVGAVFLIHKDEQFSERWMKDVRKGVATVSEEIEEEVFDEGDEAFSEE